METRAMILRRQPRLSTLVCVGAVLVLFNGNLEANSRITADGQLDRYHLDKAEEALLGYLEAGIPQDFSGDFNERWEMYQWIAAKLGEMGSNNASPTLIQLIEEPLPPPLQDDLLFHVAGYRGHDSWEDWDDQRVRDLAELRKACAHALAKIGDEDALPALLAYLETLGQSIKNELEKKNPDSSLLWSYSSVCRDVTALGSKAGIDALIATLDHLPQRAPETIVYYLRICTRQPFGPEYSQPLHTRPAEIQKWHEWWKQNRDGFRIDRQRVLDTEKPDLPRPVPVSLRDHVAAAYTRHMDSDGSGYGKHSADWLEKDGSTRTAEFAAIVNNCSEDSRVRKEALKWYARFAGDSALDLLTTYATDDKIYSETGTEWLHLQTEALNLIQGQFPQMAEDVARRCMFSEHYVSSNAVSFLMKSASNYTYVAENFTRLGHLGRLEAIQSLLWLSEPVGRPAFFEGMKDSDIHMAVFAARGIRKFALEAELPQTSREALTRWREDPEFLLLLMIEESMPEGDRVAAIQEALQLVQKTDAHAARTYYTAWTMLPSDSRDTAMAGLVRCLEDYKKSRGLH